MDDPSDFRESVLRQIEQLQARQTALDGLVTQVLALLCVKMGPHLSAELIDKIRSEMHVQGAQPNDRFVLLVEEYVAKLADRIERAHSRMTDEDR